MSKGGGGSSQPQQVTSTTTNLPEYAKPFYENLLGRATYESERGYEAYPGQRIADFNPYETMGMTGMADLAMAGDPEQFNQASYIASQVGFQDPNQAGDIVSQYNPATQYSGYFAGDIGADYNAGDINNQYVADQRQVGYTPQDFNAGYDPRELDQGYQARDIVSQYDPNLIGTGPVFEAGTVADPETMQRYMNPYQQLVTDIEKREVQRAADIQENKIGAQAAQSGGLGGYREAILLAEQDRNLQQQLGDIQSRGDQANFAQAQKAFEADRAARLQASRMGLQQGTAADAARQRGEAFRQGALGQTEKGRQTEQSLEAQAYQIGEQARQKAADMGFNAQQQEDASRQALERFSQSQFAQNDALRLSQQQQDLAVYQAGQAAQQEASRQGLSAQEIQERVKKAQEDAFMQARSENNQNMLNRANLGLQGLASNRDNREQMLRAAGMLGGFGGQGQQMTFDRLRNLQAAGQNLRGMDQRSLDMGYQDFLRQQAFGREQLGLLSNLLQGIPISPGSTTSTYGGSPSNYQQMLGAGIGGVGLYNALGG